MTRDSSSRVIVEGVYDTDGDVLEIDFPLPNADSFSIESQTETNKQTVPGADDNENVLAPVSGQRQIRLQGQTSFFRLDKEFGSLDEKNSVRRFCRLIESLVLPQQGAGWGLEDIVRGESYNPVDSRGILFDSVSWDYSGEGEQRMEWTVQGEFSEGVQQRDNPLKYVNRVGTSYDGPDQLEVGDFSIEFEFVNDRRVDRSTNINSSDLIHQLGEDSPVVGAIDQGIDTEVSVSGTVYRPENFESIITTFDRELQGQEAVFKDAFSGTEWTGTVASSDSTIESARPNRFDFSVTLEIGETLI